MIRDFITWLYVKYVFAPEIMEAAKELEVEVRLVPSRDEVEEAMEEQEHHTLQ